MPSTLRPELLVAALIRDAALARRSLPMALKGVPNGEGDSRRADGLRALAELAQGDLARAVQSSGPVRYHVGDTERVLLHGALSFDLRRYDEALKDFEWVRDHGRRGLTAYAGVMRFKIAQSLEAAGRTADARAAYADFLAFWKTADDDLPIVVEARQALARLGAS